MPSDFGRILSHPVSNVVHLERARSARTTHACSDFKWQQCEALRALNPGKFAASEWLDVAAM